MISKAEGKFLRISPSKVRLVMDLIRGKDAAEAQSILLHLNKRPKEYLLKILKSAVANAKVKGFGVDKLYISKIVCNPGPMWKRFKAAAFGRAASIVRRTAHIKIELDLKESTRP
ncbi:MAG: 50S ribosomal protein L22 [Candidatus Omnitrophota bacterium]|jgi:large subunit ribosomal protein L22